MNKNKQNSNHMTGIFLLDKAQGITSNRALQQVKKLLMPSKAGHTGSLDPLATGMLPICLDEATKFAQYLLHADKHYQVTACLGIKTTTGDAEGEVLQVRDIPEINLPKLQNIFNMFLGDIQQVPPMYSALKFKGQPLYKLARQGIQIERAARSVHIHQLESLHFSQQEMILRVHCSSGTYIRSLIEDMGEVLGCGAHITALRRLQVGTYCESQMLTLSEIAQHPSPFTLLQSLDSALTQYPVFYLTDQQVVDLYYGRQVLLSSALSNVHLVRLYQSNQKFIGIGEVTIDGYLKSKRLLQFENK